ncbi:MAG: helix-turn-helix domain-containing protein [Clostridiales bacterium]|nr:MAG: helix-turn-helix domain-containing protein [Clostridiales bacterium]
MNKRQIEILKKIFIQKEFTTFAHLAEKFNVSVKTVRNDIGAIKDFSRRGNRRRRGFGSKFY